MAHRRCVTKERLIELIIEGHARDHRQADSIYETGCVTGVPDSPGDGGSPLQEKLKRDVQ